MKSNISKALLVSAALFSTLRVLAQYSIDWHSIDSGGGMSTGGVYSMIGTIAQPDAGEMSGGDYTMDGGFSSILETIPATTTIFDNTGGSNNGIEFANTTTWRANKFCLGPQSYTLDSVTLPLSNRDTPPVSTVQLQIYSDDPVTGKPSASTGLMMNLSGATNPITFTVVAGSNERPITWTAATPFILSPNRCYWAVLTVDSGEVLQTVSATMPSGAAGAFGRVSSTDAGVTWGSADNASNCKMLIRGTALPTAQELIISALNISGNALSFSFPTTAGRSYTIESRADVAAGEWTTIPGTTRVGSGAAIEMTLTNALTQPQQFYRIKQLP